MSDLFKALTTNQETTIDPGTSVYETLVGEGKKFKDPETLARSKLESDSFIEQLKREAQELREELSRRQSAEEIKTQILEGLRTPQAPGQQPPVTPPANGDSEQKPDIEKLIKETLAKTEAERKAQSNRQIVAEKLSQKFGQDAQIELNKIAKDLSVSLEYLERLAVESPTVFFRTIGLDQTGQAPTQNAPAPRSTSATPAPQSGVRNKAYYDRLKAQDPKAYFSPKVQNQMYKDAMELRDAFY